MPRSARLTSIDAVDTLAAAVRRFQEEAGSALMELQLEVNRVLDWIDNDRPGYWKNQVRRGWERLAEARADLERAQWQQRVAGHEPTCHVEKKALERAKQRLRIAEEKLREVQHWRHVVQRAMIDYRGGTGPLARWLEVELPKVLVALDRMGRALESYVATEPSADLPAELRAAGTAEAADDQPGRPAEAAADAPPGDAGGDTGPNAAGPDEVESPGTEDAPARESTE
jgi:hypothetical protein